MTHAPLNNVIQNWLRRYPQLTLGLLGLVSELVYLSYVLLFPLPIYGNAPRPYDMEQIAGTRHWMGAVWLGGLLILYAAFALALVTARDTHPRASLSPVLIFSCIFSFTLVWLYPVTATDLFQYVLRARVWVIHGANPMGTPPAAFADDPLLPFAGEWHTTTSPYGPVWELLAGGVASLGFTTAVSGALAYKGVALLGYLACLALLISPASHGRRDELAGSLLLFAWNPLVLIQGVGNGHNDVVMLAWTLLALVICQRRTSSPHTIQRPMASIAAATIASLTKVAAGLMSLLIVLDILRSMPARRRVLSLVSMGAVATGLGLLAYTPFWPPWHSITGILDEMNHRYTYTIAATLRLWLSGSLPAQVAWDVPRTAGQLLFLSMLGWASIRLWQRRLDLISAGFLVYFTYLMTGASYRIWYPLWLVPLAALSASRAARWRTLLMCFTSELSIVFFYFVWRWLWPQASWLQMHLLIVPWQFGIPLLLPIILTRQGTVENHTGGRDGPR